MKKNNFLKCKNELKTSQDEKLKDVKEVKKEKKCNHNVKVVILPNQKELKKISKEILGKTFQNKEDELKGKTKIILEKCSKINNKAEEKLLNDDTKKNNYIEKKIKILKTKIKDHLGFISNQKSNELMNEIAFFDRIMSEDIFWDKMSNGNIYPDDELKMKFKLNIGLLKKSECFRFFKQFILGDNNLFFRTSIVKENDSYEDLELIKTKNRFLMVFKKINFFNKNMIYLLSSFSFISEKIKETLFLFLLPNLSIEQFTLKLEAKVNNPLLNFIKKTSFELIFKIRQQKIKKFIPQTLLSKKIIYTSNPNSDSESEISPNNIREIQYDDQYFENQIRSAQNLTSSNQFHLMLDHLQKSSNFENKVHADPIYGLFENKHIPLPYMKLWLYLKAKCEFFKNEINMSKNLFNLEVKRNIQLVSTNLKKKESSEKEKKTILGKRNYNDLDLPSIYKTS